MNAWMDQVFGGRHIDMVSDWFKAEVDKINGKFLNIYQEKLFKNNKFTMYI